MSRLIEVAGRIIAPLEGRNPDDWEMFSDDALDIINSIRDDPEAMYEMQNRAVAAYRAQGRSVSIQKAIWMAIHAALTVEL